MKFLVYAEHKDGVFKNATFETIGCCAKFGDVEALVIGQADAASLGKYGAKTVHHIKDGLAAYSPEGYAQVIHDVAKSGGFDWIMSPASTVGKDVLPRVAAKLKSAMVSEFTEVEKDGDNLVLTRPVYSGKAFQKVKPTGNKPFIGTLRPNVFPVPAANGSAAAIKDVSGVSSAVKYVVKNVVKGQSSKPDLTEASVIVAGGRSLKSAENFKILEELADAIGATVGASRAAVDAGFATHSMQVGQTGKTVSPNLYIACGISGAIQHLAGMRSSKVIVAINTDPEAPIFQRADYGIVGDLFKVVPLLTAEFKKALGK